MIYLLIVYLLVNIFVYFKSKDPASVWYYAAVDTEDAIFRNVATLGFGSILFVIYILATVLTVVAEKTGLGD